MLASVTQLPCRSQIKCEQSKQLAASTGACSHPSATSRLPKPRSSTTPCWTTHPWQH